MGNSVSNSNNSEGIPEQNNNIIANQANHTWEKAVNGNTEELNLRPKVTHAAFESTSENMPFTVSEKAISVPIMKGAANLSETSVMQNYNENNSNKPYYNEYMQAKQQYLNSKMKGAANLSETSVMQNYNENNANKPYYNEYMQAKQQYLNSKMKGGFIFDKIANLFNETEVNVFDNNSNLIDSKLNQIRSLLQDSETNNLVGGDISSQRIRDLLLQDTESFINFRGGENKESEHKEHKKHAKHVESKHNELKEEEKEEKEEKEEEQKEEKEEKEEEHEQKQKEEKEEKEVNEISEQMQKTDDEESDQSGGENLDTELKVILKELQANNNHKGGKSSRKSSKKSNKSKKQSRRATTEESEATNGTYDIDTDESDGGDEDYLTSTSSMNTSDININHYKS
jgi:hypothetical protein